MTITTRLQAIHAMAEFVRLENATPSDMDRLNELWAALEGYWGSAWANDRDPIWARFCDRK